MGATKTEIVHYQKSSNSWSICLLLGSVKNCSHWEANSQFKAGKMTHETLFGTVVLYLGTTSPPCRAVDILGKRVTWSRRNYGNGLGLVAWGPPGVLLELQQCNHFELYHFHNCHLLEELWTFFVMYVWEDFKCFILTYLYMIAIGLQFTIKFDDEDTIPMVSKQVLHLEA